MEAAVQAGNASSLMARRDGYVPRRGILEDGDKGSGCSSKLRSGLVMGKRWQCIPRVEIPIRRLGGGIVAMATAALRDGGETGV